METRHIATRNEYAQALKRFLEILIRKFEEILTAAGKVSASEILSIDPTIFNQIKFNETDASFAPEPDPETYPLLLKEFLNSISSFYSTIHKEMNKLNELKSKKNKPLGSDTYAEIIDCILRLSTQSILPDAQNRLAEGKKVNAFLYNALNQMELLVEPYEKMFPSLQSSLVTEINMAKYYALLDITCTHAYGAIAAYVLNLYGATSIFFREVKERDYNFLNETKNKESFIKELKDELLNYQDKLLTQKKQDENAEKKNMLPLRNISQHHLAPYQKNYDGIALKDLSSENHTFTSSKAETSLIDQKLLAVQEILAVVTKDKPINEKIQDILIHFETHEKILAKHRDSTIVRILKNIGNILSGNLLHKKIFAVKGKEVLDSYKNKVRFFQCGNIDPSRPQRILTAQTRKPK